MRQFRVGIFLLLCVMFSSWGWQGHRVISSSILDCFNEEMQIFEDWVPFLTEHASDADYRKSEDPSERPKHYIDLDNYPEFNATGRIPSTLDSCINLHGEDFVDNNGYLPWATIDTYNGLVESIKHYEWDDAKTAAADLGHYVGDGFMPLHLTRNYNGQYTGNDGIHYRYESDMVGEYIEEFTYDGQPVEEIEDVSAFIFSYIYNNYQYVDSVIMADDIAKTESGGNYNSTYLETLWEETEEFTIQIFSGASHAFASLLYAAWTEAGKPDIDPAELFVSTPDGYNPDFIGVTYGELGMIYVVPLWTEKELDVIRAACLDSLPALANVEVKIPIADLGEGDYWLYARDNNGRLSGPVDMYVRFPGIRSFDEISARVYPNPVGDACRISFDLDAAGEVRLLVSDASGRTIRVVSDQKHPAGNQCIEFNTEAITPGTYFLMLEIRDEIFIEKLLKH